MRTTTNTSAVPPLARVILPIRDFQGMSRLSTVLSPTERTLLSRVLSDRAVLAVRAASLDLIVLSSSHEVRSWAEARAIDVALDPGGGLSSAARHTVAEMGDRPWILLHADLPLVNARDLARVARTVLHAAVLAPSHDGGTNLIAATGAFPFAYGPGSFHRHLKSMPNAEIISTPGLSIDIDTPSQLHVFADLRELSNLQP